MSPDITQLIDQIEQLQRRLKCTLSGAADAVPDALQEEIDGCIATQNNAILNIIQILQKV